jgi:hypothetical protein
MKLLEIVGPNIDIPKIKQLCAPYIEVLKQTDGVPLFRGYNKSFKQIQGFNVVVPRPNRKPTDTPLFLHNALNQQFIKHFNYPFRNGVFACGSYDDAHYYGTVYAVFPVGKLNYVWSQEIIDLFKYLDRSYHFDTIENDQVAIEQAAEEVIGKYIDNDLDKAIRMGHEVMLANKCIMIKDYGLYKDDILS